MIVVSTPGGGTVRVHVHQRYDPSLDGEGIRLSAWYDGKEYWGTAKVEPGKSQREAKDALYAKIERAIRDGTPGQV